MRIAPKQRRLFFAAAVKLLLDLGAQHEDGESDRFVLSTNAGPLRLHPSSHQTEGLGTLFTRFDIPEAARQLVGCNPYSGKWNHHYFEGWTVEAALEHFSAQLKRILA